MGGALSCVALKGSNAVAAPFDPSRVNLETVNIERGFEAVNYGQLHYRRAVPKKKSDIKHRPIVCFHQTPNSSQVFVELMVELAQDRVVYAVDTPGLGESDLPSEPPEIIDYAQAMYEFLKVKRLRKVNVVGYHTGASIASELALLAPKRIKKMILVGIALFDDTEKAKFFEQPWPKPAKKDGSHLQPSWQRTFKWQGPGMSDESVIRSFIAKTSAGETAWWGARAVMRHDLAQTLSKITIPFMGVNPKDDLYEITPRLRDIRPDIEIVDKSDFAFGIFDADTQGMADLTRRYFDKRP